MTTPVTEQNDERDFGAVFATVTRKRAGGLVIGAGVFFHSRSEQLATLAVHHAVPTVFESREFVAAGGLASYRGVLADSYRMTGIPRRAKVAF